MLIRFEPGINRGQLEFKEAVQAEFEFLTKEYGFRCVEEKVTFVRYESPKVFVNIFHGRGSFAMGFEIGLLSNKEGVYNLNEILRIAGVLEINEYAHFQVTTKEGVKKFLHKMADMVKEYAQGVLAGDPVAFEELRIIQKKWSDGYIKDMKLGYIRPKADLAWREKRYGDFIKLFEPVEGDLTRVEVKKLEYARKHLK